MSQCRGSGHRPNNDYAQAKGHGGRRRTTAAPFGLLAASSGAVDDAGPWWDPCCSTARQASRDPPRLTRGIYRPVQPRGPPFERAQDQMRVCVDADSAACQRITSDGRHGYTLEGLDRNRFGSRNHAAQIQKTKHLMVHLAAQYRRLARHRL